MARIDRDQYPTPEWCIIELLKMIEVLPSAVLDPCAGNGGLLKTINQNDDFIKTIGKMFFWFGVEIVFIAIVFVNNISYNTFFFIVLLHV